MIVTHMLAILLAYILDLIIGDPKTWPHPVKTFGKLIAFLDRKLNRKRKREGVWLVFLVVLFVFLVSFGVTILAYSIHYFLGLGIETILIATTIAQKGLKEAAWAVY